MAYFSSVLSFLSFSSFFFESQHISNRRAKPQLGLAKFTLPDDKLKLQFSISFNKNRFIPKTFTSEFHSWIIFSWNKNKREKKRPFLKRCLEF